MAKNIKKTENKRTISKKETVLKNEKKPCITCGKQFQSDFKSIVGTKKLEYEKFNRQYFVFKNENESWSIASETSFNILKENNNITEWFHIREFEPK